MRLLAYAPNLWPCGADRWRHPFTPCTPPQRSCGRGRAPQIPAGWAAAGAGAGARTPAAGRVPGGSCAVLAAMRTPPPRRPPTVSRRPLEASGRGCRGPQRAGTPGAGGGRLQGAVPPPQTPFLRSICLVPLAPHPSPHALPLHSSRPHQGGTGAGASPSARHQPAPLPAHGCHGRRQPAGKPGRRHERPGRTVAGGRRGAARAAGAHRPLQRRPNVPGDLLQPAAAARRPPAASTGGTTAPAAAPTACGRPGGSRHRRTGVWGGWVFDPNLLASPPAATACQTAPSRPLASFLTT